MVFIAVVSLVATPAFSQTKKIWHKSHSGSNTTFHRSLQHNLFGIEYSDFGLKQLKINVESIRKINDTCVVIYYHRYSTQKSKNDPKPSSIQMYFYGHNLNTLQNREQVLEWVIYSESNGRQIEIMNSTENFPIEGFPFKPRK